MSTSTKAAGHAQAMDALAQLAATAASFAAESEVAIVPAVPERGCGPEVCLGPGTLDLPGFLSLAARLGNGVLYLSAPPFDPDHGDDRPKDPPAHLTRRKGEVGQISVAFAANGLVHFWEQETAWHEEWRELGDSQALHRDYDPGDEDQEERLSREERAQIAGELASAILADPRFRAASRGERQRLARLALPTGTDDWAGWDAIRQACDQAQDMAQERYDELTGRLDDLAAEFLASAEYQQASSAAGRKQAAERFLVPRADGFCPPPLVRDELYARAQELAKAAKSPAVGLF